MGWLKGKPLPSAHRLKIADGLRRPIKDRLMRHVQVNALDCWIWTGHRNSWGYGRIGDSGRLVMAHRVSYEIHVGPIPDGMSVLHRCDVPACVNPGHLFLGTLSDNARDMVRKGRNVRLCGENSPSAKLTSELVAEIRASRDTTVSGLSRKYGVSRRAIGFILKGETWNS